MQIVKTFIQRLYDTETDAYELVNKTVVIGSYPNLTIAQLVSIVKEYENNPEPDCHYSVYDETKQEIIYRHGIYVQKQNCIRILDPLCVNKTYPDFWKDFKKLTGASFEIPKAE